MYDVDFAVMTYLYLNRCMGLICVLVNGACQQPLLVEFLQSLGCLADNMCIMYSCSVRIFPNNQQKVVIDELNNSIKNDGSVLLIFGLNVKLFIIWGMKGKDRKKTTVDQSRRKDIRQFMVQYYVLALHITKFNLLIIFKQLLVMDSLSIKNCYLVYEKKITNIQFLIRQMVKSTIRIRNISYDPIQIVSDSIQICYLV